MFEHRNVSVICGNTMNLENEKQILFQWKWNDTGMSDVYGLLH